MDRWIDVDRSIDIYGDGWLTIARWIDGYIWIARWMAGWMDGSIARSGDGWIALAARWLSGSR